MYFLHLIGSAMSVVVIAFIIVDIIHKKALDIKGLIGRLLIILVCFISLLRV